MVLVDAAGTHLDETGQFDCPVLMIAVDGRMSTHPLPPAGLVRVGRDARADVVIDHPHVSRMHAELRVDKTGITVADLGSANGTWVRERRLPLDERCPLASGELLRLGRSVCCWIDDRRKGSAPGEPPASPLLATVEKIAPGSIAVLLLGETGVGKGFLAREIHERSGRADGPFLTLDCALLEGALERELFGTDGDEGSRMGLLESAQGGTVFLDEVWQLSLSTQAKLLRPIEERVVQRLGAVAARPIDVRFVAASNRDLEAEVAAGRFRRDLFFRLNGFALTIPPLRARPDEVLPLAREFARFHAAQLGRPVPELAESASAALCAHAWPGNVRELRSAIERALLLCGDGPLEAEHLCLQPAPEAGAPPAPSAPEQPEELERILRALQDCGGNQSRAARLLGVSRSTLIRKLEQFGVPRPHARKTVRSEPTPPPEE